MMRRRELHVPEDWDQLAPVYTLELRVERLGVSLGVFMGRMVHGTLWTLDRIFLGRRRRTTRTKESST